MTEGEEQAMADTCASSKSETDEKHAKPKLASQLSTVLLWTALSIAMIVIGSMHVGNCPAEPNIPIYLIVAGTFHLIAFLLIPLKLVAENLAYILESIIGLFCFCWFITGSVWVFRIYPDNPRGCNDLVYNFAFGILIFEYIFIALTIFVICLCTCCAGVLVSACCNADDPSEP
ncbi:hypothetical protein GDO86_008526 [Hymenochirus boettgeri]|uniref:Uncharacterized protein n=1 Tax=Hymenochirus boettgeri TaxID=247094 RepID=A0A8T2J3B6_9PIPI|nr:hypothetical protein GDO86_008526 [Hymenochirus boettgeri]